MSEIPHSEIPDLDISEPEHEVGGDQEISLDELSEAFAQVIGGAGLAAADEGNATDGEPGVSPSEDEAPQDDACEVSPRSIFEAMLFVGNLDGRPLSAQHAADLMRGVEPEEIGGLVEELNHRYATNRCPYRVMPDAGGFRLALCAEYRPLQNRFYGRIREARLSQAAIDVLAIVAYQQPLASEEVSRLRGKPSGHVLAQLVRRGLLRIERDAAKGRKPEYHTTDRFLKLFGLEGLGDLPQSEDLEGQ